jgi:hypothetical protein
MANLESFVCEAVDAVKFKLGKYLKDLQRSVFNKILFLAVRDPSDVDKTEIVFKADMAHQIYGETENIFGYKDLQINVYYSAGPLDIYYDVKYSKKVKHFPQQTSHWILKFLYIQT